MMKTLYLLMALLAFSNLSFGQSYAFELSNATYAELDQGQVVIDDTANAVVYVTLPFLPRTFGHNMKDTLIVGLNGFVITTSSDYSFALDPYLTALTLPESSSTVSVQVDGTNGNHIFKIQWKNVGTAADSSDRLNFQMWVYEADQKVEIHFGPGSSDANHVSGLYLLSPDFNTSYERYTLQGDPNSPVLTNLGNPQVAGFPDEGTVYRFNYLRVGIEEMPETKAMKAYPNPGSGFRLLVEDEVKKVMAYDVSGRETQVIQEGDTYVLPKAGSGMYFIQVQLSDGSWQQLKWMKQ